jgi:hypothetical protein
MSLQYERKEGDAITVMEGLREDAIAAPSETLVRIPALKTSYTGEDLVAALPYLLLLLERANDVTGIRISGNAFMSVSCIMKACGFEPLHNYGQTYHNHPYNGCKTLYIKKLTSRGKIGFTDEYATNVRVGDVVYNNDNSYTYSTIIEISRTFWSGVNIYILDKPLPNMNVNTVSVYRTPVVIDATPYCNISKYTLSLVIEYIQTIAESIHLSNEHRHQTTPPSQGDIQELQREVSMLRIELQRLTEQLHIQQTNHSIDTT